MGAVGGADLAQHRAGAGHDLGDAERAADLDQFAARDRHLAPERQRVQHQQHRRGIVVDDGGRLGAGDLAQQAGDVFVALAAPPGGEVEFQRGGGRERLGGRGGGGSRQRRAAEIGVQHRAGQVEHRTLRGGEAARQRIGGSVQDGRGQCRERASRPARRQFGTQRGRWWPVRPNRATNAAAAGMRSKRIERRQRAGGIRHGGAMLGRMSTTFEIPTLRTDRLALRAFRPPIWMRWRPCRQTRRCAGSSAATCDARGGMVVDGAEPGPMGAARLRHVRGRGRGALRRLGRRAASAGMAGTGAGLFARSAVLGARHRHRSGLARRATGPSRGSTLSRLASFIMPDNVRSARVAEKLGAVRDGTTTIRGFAVDWWVHRRAQEVTKGRPPETLEMG